MYSLTTDSLPWGLEAHLRSYVYGPQRLGGLGQSDALVCLARGFVRRVAEGSDLLCITEKGINMLRKGGIKVERLDNAAV